MKRKRNKVLIVFLVLAYLFPSFPVMAQEAKPIPKSKNGKWGYVDTEGKKVIAFKYGDAKAFSEGLAAVRPKNGKWGYIDEKGKVIIPFMYSWTYNDEAALFHKGIALVMANSKYFFIDKTGQAVSPSYDHVGMFSADGLAPARLEGKYGFIDRRGKLVTILYDRVAIPSEGMAKVILNKKIGYIDKTGKEVIPCKYDEIGNFSINMKELAVFRAGDRIGFIDKNGTESDIESLWSELPVKFKGVGGEISIIGLKTGKKDGNTFITLYGTGLDVIPLAFNGSADYSRMVNAAITTCDGEEFEAATFETDVLSLTLHFKTSSDPQYAFLYIGNDPDNKIKIDFK